MEVIGEARALVWDYIDQSVRLYTPDNNTYQVYQENINTELNQMYLKEMEHFEKCIQRECVPEQDLREGRAALVLAERIASRRLQVLGSVSSASVVTTILVAPACNGSPRTATARRIDAEIRLT